MWAGKENCEPVTWKECTLEPTLVNFTIPETSCVRNGSINWDDCIEVDKTIMTTSLVCTILHTTSCRPKTTNKCQTISYQECFEEAEENCQPVTIAMPKQTYEHKKKCLLSGNKGSGK